jgi:hypothetical protein
MAFGVWWEKVLVFGEERRNPKARRRITQSSQRAQSSQRREEKKPQDPGSHFEPGATSVVHYSSLEA